MEDTLVIKYADTSQVAYIDANGNLTTITYAALLDSLNVPGADSSLYSTINYTDSMANTKGWIFPFPDSFSYRPPFHILKNPNTGAYLIDPAFNLRSYASVPKGVTYYVDVVNGNDANSGLTSALAFKSLNLAVAKTDVGRIYIDYGYYYKQYGWNGVTPTRSFELIATGENVTLTTDVSNTLTYVLEGNLYKAYTTTAVTNAWDRTRSDKYGDPLTLQAYTSRAQVDTSTVGAWYYATDTLFVRLIDNDDPTDSTAIFTSGQNIVIDGEGLKYYFHGFDMIGGGITISNADGSQGGCNVYIDSVNLRGGSIFVDGVSEFFYFNSSVAKTKSGDLINYDPENGVYTSYVENNIRSYNNNDAGGAATTDQASTAHIGTRGIRLNSFYGYTGGQGIADVDSCQSWVINCEVDSGGSNANYFFGTGDKCYAWLQDCESYDRPAGGYDIDGTGANIYINGFVSDNYDYGVSTGNLDSNYSYQLYEPTEAALVERVFDTRLKGRLPTGSNGQTLYFSGTSLTPTSFLRSNGTTVSVGNAGQALGSTFALIVRQTGNALFNLSTASAGAERTIYLNGTDGTWFIGAQNNINSGELRINKTGIPLTPFLGIGSSGHIGIGIASSSTYKVNIAGNLRIGTTTISTSKSDSLAGFVGSTQEVIKIPRGVFMQNNDSVSNANITMLVTVPHYSFDGSTATWTLPTIAASDGYTFFIKNRGSGNLTINTSGGGSEIYDSAATNSITVSAGASVILHNDGTYFTTQ